MRLQWDIDTIQQRMSTVLDRRPVIDVPFAELRCLALESPRPALEQTVAMARAGRV
jgi:hypothetical protein